jgi:hypothetical protein
MVYCRTYKPKTLTNVTTHKFLDVKYTQPIVFAIDRFKTCEGKHGDRSDWSVICRILKTWRGERRAVESETYSNEHVNLLHNLDHTT